MNDFDDRSGREEGRRVDYPFAVPKNSRLDELQIPKDIQEASQVIEAPLEDLFSHPERYNFSRVQELAAYLAGEENRASIHRMGGAIKQRTLFFENPEPVAAEPIPVREVWRFSENRLAACPEVVLGYAFSPQYLQFEQGAKVTEDALHVGVVDCGEEQGSPYYERPVHRWPIRIPAQGALVLDGRLLRNGYIEFKAADDMELPRYPELQRLRLGTVKSLSLLGAPGSFKMREFEDKKSMREDFKNNFLGMWNDQIHVKRGGSELHISFKRAGGIFSKRSLEIQNKGDIAIALKFYLGAENGVG